MKVYIGVDPGASGALAAITVDGGVTLETFRLSETPHDVWEWLDALVSEETTAALERVHALPGQGVSSTFKFGASYGFCRGILVASLLPFVEVAPHKWQQALGVKKRGKDEPKTAHKRRLKELAQSLYPGAKITNAEADAILIAEWLRRQG